ncbi:hypothetical protein GCM10025868_20500 [Angustibacter aerolatus]|uniref:Uncharacterized protein n=1 Tax=Angustibacter aerolatus TaxID=1162965 RepID=A0ABQ6JIZ9_9ACTN|nr:hypothetical protein GCM10025868_20500 [Angustibacter aerolatus]
MMRPSATRATSTPRTTGSPSGGPNAQDWWPRLVVHQRRPLGAEHEARRVVEQPLRLGVERVVAGHHLVGVGEDDVGRVHPLDGGPAARVVALAEYLQQGGPHQLVDRRHVASLRSGACLDGR